MAKKSPPPLPSDRLDPPAPKTAGAVKTEKKKVSGKEVLLGCAVLLGVFALFGGAQDDEKLPSPAQDAEVETDVDVFPQLIADAPTLADYKDLRPKDRETLVEAFTRLIEAPEDSVELFVTCMGDYAFTKSEELETEKVLGWCENERQNIPDRFASHFNELDAEDLSIHAGLVCKDLVRDRLLSPSGAKFPWLSTDVRRYGRQSYHAGGPFEALNAFGVMLPMRYACRLQHDLTGDPHLDSSWEIEAVEVWN